MAHHTAINSSNSSLETPSPTLHFHWGVVAIFLVAAILTVPFDVQLARLFADGLLPGELRRAIHKAEAFGHIYGVLGIVITLYLVCVDQRRKLARLLSTAILAGLVADMIKMLVCRVRPLYFSFEEGASTFRGFSFLSADSAEQIFDSQFQSFPSAHTAVAVGFALALGAMFPRAARWFLILAAACAASRFDGGAHYVSDTLIGALVGYGCAVWTMGDTRLAARFSKYERATPEQWGFWSPWPNQSTGISTGTVADAKWPRAEMS